jgi:hypothetical protein
MIGPAIEGFRTGQRVKIADTTHPDYGTTGYITAIIGEASGYRFQVDIGEAKKSKRPVVRQLTSAQLHPA